MKGTAQIFIVMGLIGCAPEQTAYWQMGAGYRWNGLNHRLSFLHQSVTDDVVRTGVIGGTSTTGMLTTLPDGCSFSECQELPVKDTSTAWVRWGGVTTRQAQFAHAEVSFNVSESSTTEAVSFSFERPTKHITALITGWQWDTNEPLIGGPECYDPFNGWHPRRMEVGIAPNSADDSSFDVTGVFEAGNSVEDIRKCIDAVNEEAQVNLKVYLLAVDTKELAETQSVSHGAEYELGSKSEPNPQNDPDLSERPLTLPVEDHVLGWTSLAFSFHEDDEAGRGAYLRHLMFDINTDDVAAYGHATNYSPGSQLSGFDYTFNGEIVSIPVRGAFESGLLELQLEAVVDDDKVPVLTETEI